MHTQMQQSWMDLCMSGDDLHACYLGEVLTVSYYSKSMCRHNLDQDKLRLEIQLSPLQMVPVRRNPLEN